MIDKYPIDNDVLYEIKHRTVSCAFNIAKIGDRGEVDLIFVDVISKRNIHKRHRKIGLAKSINSF